MNILVTGCGGFIGSNVSQLLAESGHQATGVDNVGPPDSPLVRWRLHDLLGNPRFALHNIDIRDREDLSRVFQDSSVDVPIAAVIHLAARAGVRASVDDPRSCYETNVLGTLNVLELCRDFGVNQFILASTSSVYGIQSGGPMSEDVPSNRPLSPYPESTEGGGQVSVLQWPKGAPLNLG